MHNKRGKRAQMSIFIIIGILLVAVVVLIVLFHGRILPGKKVPTALQPAYNLFLSCLETDALAGIDILEVQGGYIELPEFDPGSEFSPFSSQLDFLGNPVPYWYYVSGNGIQKEQIPSKDEMEKQLADFIEEKIKFCDFSSLEDEGFIIAKEKPRAVVNIKEDSVDIHLDMGLRIEKAEEVATLDSHKLTVDSQLGKLYGTAKKIYKKEQDSLFLEERAVDILRLYAPVDGVEISCSPKIWKTQDVFDELHDAIVSNTLALKTKGGRYKINSREDKYFVLDIDTGKESVNFLTSKEWPYKFEVWPSDGAILMASPVGTQAGLGILGFCYTPYHFVYDVMYPVLIQVSDAGMNEIFQFPVAVVLKKNKPREPIGEAEGAELPELCNYKNTPVTLSVRNSDMMPLNAEISFECFGTSCYIGKAEAGELRANFPQCLNGYVRARAEGYLDGETLLSTNEQSSAEIILDKKYPIQIDLKLNGREYNGDAIISFLGDKLSSTVVYPEQKEVELVEGDYEIKVYIYRNSSLRLEGFTKEQCVEVPRSGIGGFLGMTKKKCFDIKIPEQIISNVLVGGGSQKYYVLDSELKQNKKIEINAESLPIPKTIEDLQDNYLLFEDKYLGISFK